MDRSEEVRPGVGSQRTYGPALCRSALGLGRTLRCCAAQDGAQFGLRLAVSWSSSQELSPPGFPRGGRTTWIKCSRSEPQNGQDETSAFGTALVRVFLSACGQFGS